MDHYLLEIIRSGATFIVVLGVLVSAHEFGHYLAARLCGVHVEVFSIGFGPAICGWVDRRGTRWRVAWLPLGGYVKMHGQERPEDLAEGVRASLIAGHTFHGKPVAARALIVSAGPAANFILAVILFAGLFASVGRPITLGVVVDVLPRSAAERAGLLVGDKVQSISGIAVDNFEDIQHIVAARPGQTLSILVSRGGATRTIDVRTEAREDGGQLIGLLGIRGGIVEYRHLTLAAAIWGGVTQTSDVAAETAGGMVEMIAGRKGAEDLGGPIRIAQLSGQMVQLGTASLISFVAVLSVNLGLINLFPIPVLDGGHLLFYLAEALLGRPLPPHAQEYGYRAGLALLVGLFVFATWNDLGNVGLIHWLARIIG